MRYFRIFLGAGLIGLFALVAYLTLLSYGLLGTSAVVKVKEVPAGHQEVALLLPATGGDTWERFVAAIDALETEWPKLGRTPGRLRVDKRNAFVKLTADVPEIALWFDGHEDGKLWVRWYKLSSEANARHWVGELAKRQPAPLAVVGGDSSRNALQLAEALKARAGDWHGRPPLFLITTATAERSLPADLDVSAYVSGDAAVEQEFPRLIEVYPGRTFRFAFTNSRMAEAVLDFVEGQPELRGAPVRTNVLEIAALAVGTGAAGGPGCGLGLKLILDRYQQPILHTVTWEDDHYSVDLSRRFTQTFVRRLRRGPLSEFDYSIPFSAGDYAQPNRYERLFVRDFTDENARHRDQRQLLVLPTAAQRAQRWLNAAVRHLTPTRRRNLIVVSGDSITFNNLYRDRHISWNAEDLNVALVVFSHRTPIEPSVGFREQQPGAELQAANMGTDDLLLYRDLVECLLLAAYQGDRLLADADAVRARLGRLSWAGERVAPEAAGEPLFDADGERRPGTGERVLWLRRWDPDRGGSGVNVMKWSGGRWRREGKELALN